MKKLILHVLPPRYAQELEKGLMQWQIINRLNELLITRRAFCTQRGRRNVSTDQNDTNISLIRLIRGACYFVPCGMAQTISDTLRGHDTLADTTRV